MWTVHKEPCGKLYYMNRKDRGSMADFAVFRERVPSNRRLSRKWMLALYELNSRECKLLGHYKTLKAAKLSSLHFLFTKGA